MRKRWLFSSWKEETYLLTTDVIKSQTTTKNGRHHSKIRKESDK